MSEETKDISKDKKVKSTTKYYKCFEKLVIIFIIFLALFLISSFVIDFPKIP